MKRVLAFVLAVLLIVPFALCGELKAEAKTIKTKAEAVEWITAAEGRYWDYDGYYGAQCVDLIFCYYEFLGAKVKYGNANHYIYDELSSNGTKLPEGWTRIKYYSGFVAQPGDIALFDYGRYGHIGLVMDGDASGMTTLENNRTEGSGTSNATSGRRSYTFMDFWGVIRPDFVDLGTIQYTDITPGRYYLQNTSNGTYLTVSGGLDQNGQNIIASSISLSDAFCMDVRKASTGYKLRPLCSASRLLNAGGTKVSSGDNVDLRNSSGKSSQWWGFEKVDGGYVIRNMMNANSVLTLSTDGNICVSSYTGDSTQIWKLQNAVQYDANGGSGAPGFQMKNYNQPLTLSSTQPDNNGEYFGGWATSASASSPQYSAGDSYAQNENLKLYAVWGCDHADLVSQTIAPTCTTAGYTDHTCNRCGYSHRDNVISATGHNYQNAVCTGCGNGYTGLLKRDGVWYYYKSGMVATGMNTLVKYNGEWWYVVKGKVASNTTAVVKYNKEWWYVVKGKIASNTTTLVKYNGSWYYIVKGKLAANTTTLVKYNGEWWYVVNGKIASKITSIVEYNGGWYYMVKGKLAAKTTTLVKYNGTWYYVRAGAVDWNFSGTVTYYGGRYTVKNGRVV